MSLDWNITQVANTNELHEVRDGKRQLGALPEALIYYSMSTGLNHISEKNVDEWFYRLKVQEKVFGPAFHKSNEKGEKESFDFTYSDVQRMVGMRTNASTLTRAQFLKNIKDYLDREASHKLYQAKAALKKAA